jgi:hydrogenase expression/formation protein
MLEKLDIDYLGVSLDSLLIFCPEESKRNIIETLEANDVQVVEVGKVVEGDKALLDGKDFSPKFRESAYTPVKKAVGEEACGDQENLHKGAKDAAEEVGKKIRKVVEYVKNAEKTET